METDASHIEELNITGLGRCPEFGEKKDPSVPSDELHVNIGLDMQKQKELHCVIGTCMEDFDTDSVADLEYSTWNDACAWEFRSASGNGSLGLIQNPPTEIIRNTRCYMVDDESPGQFGHGGYVDGGMHPPRFCLGQQHSLWNNDSMIIHRLYPKLVIYCHTNDMDYLSPAVCYDVFDMDHDVFVQ